LNQGFQRPRYPCISYFQAGNLRVHRTFGFRRFSRCSKVPRRSVQRRYSSRRWGPPAFDRLFDHHLRARYAKAIVSVGRSRGRRPSVVEKREAA
jgi:hypothetical protein